MEKTKLLSNLDLNYYCKKLGIKLNAILNKDLFKNTKAIEGCYIINLQNSNEGSGTHWTALYLKDNFGFYFDSFGLIMPQSIIKFCRKYRRNIRILYSIDQIQPLHSVYCGWYCLFFLYFMSKNQKAKNKQELINKHNSLYLKDEDLRHLNDEILKKHINHIFSKKNNY